MNWDDILKEQESDPGFAPLPASKYPVRVEKAEATKASTGADMIKVEFAVDGGPYDGKKVFTNIVFSTGNATAMKFTLRKLHALGVTRDVLSAQNPSYSQIATMILGSKAEAEVTIREYDGEKTNDVKSLRSLIDTSAPAAAPLPSTPAASPGVPPTPTIPEPEAAAPAPAPAPDAEPAEPGDEPDADEGEPF